jgi:ATP-dependent Clp protease ATP-binding subunit ClpC
LGLLKEGDGVAAKVLNNLGVDSEKARTEVIRALGEVTAVSGGRQDRRGWQ